MEEQFKILDRLETTDEVDMHAWMREFSQMYMQRPAEQRAYAVIRRFFEIDCPSEDLYDDFIVWLVDGNESQAKEAALERVFKEYSPKK